MAVDHEAGEEVVQRGMADEVWRVTKFQRPSMPSKQKLEEHEVASAPKGTRKFFVDKHNIRMCYPK